MYWIEESIQGHMFVKNSEKSEILPYLQANKLIGSVVDITLLCKLNAQITFGFPEGSDGKESACTVGDLGLIPGLGRSPGEE